MGDLETLRIVNPHEEGGYIIINKSDFDPEAHTLWEPTAEVDKDADGKNGSPNLAAMNKADLLKFATEQGVDISPSATKAEIIEALEAASK